VPNLEKPAEEIILLDIDKQDAFDYDTDTDRVIPDIKAYRKVILKEVRKIKQDRAKSKI